MHSRDADKKTRFSAQEYSDSGRSIYVEGLYLMLMAFHRREF